MSIALSRVLWQYSHFHLLILQIQSTGGLSIFWYLLQFLSFVFPSFHHAHHGGLCLPCLGTLPEIFLRKS